MKKSCRPIGSENVVRTVK